MMRNTLTIIVLYTALLSAQAADKTNSAPEIHWGAPVSGVRSSDGLNNSSVAAGTMERACLRMWNSSTNIISLYPGPGGPPYTLTNSLGKKYELREPYDYLIPEQTTLSTVTPAHTNEWTVIVMIGKEITPGDYILVPRPRDITTAGGKVCTVVPGVQTVHVK